MGTKSGAQFLVSRLIDYICVSGRVEARVLDVNMLMISGDVQMGHHLAVDKVHTKRGGSTPAMKETVRTVLKFERLKTEGMVMSLEKDFEEISRWKRR